MKKIYLISSTLLILISSCQNKDSDDICKYPNDTSLFISYRMNSEDYRFFQVIDYSYLGYPTFNTFFKTNEQAIISDQYSFYFDSLNFDGHLELLRAQIILTFYDTTLMRKYQSIPVRSLRGRLQQNYRFIIPKKGKTLEYTNLALEDTVFLRGVSLSVKNNNYSTENFITNYNYNIDSLTKYLWIGSNFDIKKIETVCSKFKLIQGEFSTSLMNLDASEPCKIENGQFRILINK